MKIGIDITALPPNPVGAGMYILHLTRSLAEIESEFEFVIFSQAVGYDLVGASSRPGFEWVILPEMSPARRLIWEQTRFPELVRKCGIDLLHSPHYTRPWSLPCASVVTFHDMTFFLYPHLHTRAKRLFFPLAIRMSARRADALIAVSESTRQDSIRLLGIPPEKITAIPLGISEEFRPVSDPDLCAAVRSRYNLPDRFLLYVGLVEPRKNLPLLLRAYHRLLAGGVRQPLVIAGRMGWMVEQVFQQIDELGIKDQVHFTGYVSPDDLPIVYNLADAFVYPSLYEGFGFPPLEAMACGAPVVTTAVSSMPENVGDAGILVPPGDEQALAQALQRILTDALLRQRLRRAGPERAALFTWKRTAQKTLQVYRQVLS